MTLLLLLIAGICNGIMDFVTHHSNHHWVKGKIWWDNNPDDGSWLNKYIDREPIRGKKPGLVTFSDAWHFFKSIMLWSIALAVTINAPMFIEGEFIWGKAPEWTNFILDLFTYRLAFGIGFNIVYWIPTR